MEQRGQRPIGMQEITLTNSLHPLQPAQLEPAGGQHSVLALALFTTASAMALHALLARLGSVTTFTSTMVWGLLGFIVASLEPEQRTVTRGLMAAALIGGCAALFLHTVGVAPAHGGEVTPLAFLFAETACRTVLCYAAAVGGMVVAAGIGASSMDAPFANASNSAQHRR